MKKIFYGLLLLTSFSYADSLNKFNFEFSYLGLTQNYKEYDTSDSILDSEISKNLGLNGIKIGINYDFFKYRNIHNYIGINYYKVEGNTEYKGSLLNGNQPYGSIVSISQNKIYEYEGLIKSEIFLHNFSIFSEFSFGNRYWKRTLSSIQEEDYEWYFLKAKLGTKINIYKNFFIGLNTDYKYAIKPTMKFDSLSFNLNNVYSYSIGIPLILSVNDKLSFNIENKYENIHIFDSDYNQGYYEPRSTTHNIYTKIGMNYKF